MSEFNVPDCLVLKFEEVEKDINKIDTQVYIFYDKKEKNYVVRGRRRWTPKFRSSTYSFISKSEKSLADFLGYIMCTNTSKINETLYNYNNFPNNTNDITYDFLNCFAHNDNEIIGYDDVEINHTIIIQKLKLLKNIYNHY